MTPNAHVRSTFDSLAFEKRSQSTKAVPTLRPIRMNLRSVLRLCERLLASVFGLSKPKMDAATLSGTSNSSSGRTRSSRVLSMCAPQGSNARSMRYASGPALKWVCCRQSAERTGQDFETCSPPFGAWLQRSQFWLESWQLLRGARHPDAFIFSRDPFCFLATTFAIWCQGYCELRFVELVLLT